MIRKPHANFSHFIRLWTCQDMPEPDQIRPGRFLAHHDMFTGHVRKQLVSWLVTHVLSNATRDRLIGS